MDWLLSHLDVIVLICFLGSGAGIAIAMGVSTWLTRRRAARAAAAVAADRARRELEAQSEAQRREAARNGIIANALSSEEGREALTSAMVAPIRRQLDYNGIGRRLLMVDELPQSALARYERDVRSIAQRRDRDVSMSTHVGSEPSETEMADEIQRLQNQLAQAHNDPNQVIITHGPTLDLNSFGTLGSGVALSGMSGNFLSGMYVAVDPSEPPDISSTLHTAPPPEPPAEADILADLERWDEI